MTAHPIEELTPLLDGALPPGRALEVARHLEGCASCRAEKERLAREGRPPRTWAGRLGPWADLSTLRWKIAAPAAAAALAAAIVVVAVRVQRAEEAAVAENLELLLEYEAVASLGDVETAEDAAVVAALEELDPRGARP